MKLVNLNPHEISVEALTIRVTFPPSREPCRIQVSQKIVDTIFADGDNPFSIPVVENVYGEVQGLPEPVEGVVYIVNALVLAALKDAGSKRTDVVAPDTGPTAIREKGQVAAVTRFVRL